MKTALPYLFPKHKKILSLDVDTIVRGDLRPLWDEVDLGDNYLAGVIEPYWTVRQRGVPYVNMGVLMWNLEKLRDGKCDKIIRSLNTTPWALAEQACVNAMCKGRIKVIGAEWNCGDWTCLEPGTEICIRHYMAYGQKKFQQVDEVKRYAAMPWGEVFRK